MVVSNAGAAWPGPIATISDDLLRRSFELNFFAHQTVAQNAVRVMRWQETEALSSLMFPNKRSIPVPIWGVWYPEGRYAVLGAAIRLGTWQRQDPGERGKR